MPMMNKLGKHRNIYVAIENAARQRPTDVISAPVDDWIKMLEASGLKDIDNGVVTISLPPDIVLANTIPLKHMHCEVIDPDNRRRIWEINIMDRYIFLKDDDSVGESINPEEAISKFASSNSDESLLYVGSVRMTIELSSKTIIEFIVPLAISRDNMWTINQIVSYTVNGKDRAYRYDSTMAFDEEFLAHQFRNGVATFYAVNVLLLNPVIQEVFQNTVEMIPIDTKPKKSSKAPSKHKIRYIKKIVINMDEIDRAFEKRGFIRHSMIWYVTGHWREYKNGKKVFIQGYWKGALRNMKDTAFQNLEPRERELVTKEENNENNNNQ